MAERLHSQYFVLPPDKDDAFPLYFEEILGGDKVRLPPVASFNIRNIQTNADVLSLPRITFQPAAYFSQTWSQMLAADAFAAVQEVGMENTEEVKKVCRRWGGGLLLLGLTRWKKLKIWH